MYQILLAGFTAGVATCGPAALLLFGTLTIVIAILSTHRGPFRNRASTRLHCTTNQIIRLVISTRCVSMHNCVRMQGITAVEFTSNFILMFHISPCAFIYTCMDARLVTFFWISVLLVILKADWFTCIRGDALVATAVVAAFLFVGTVAVFNAVLGTHSWTPLPARTESRFNCGTCRKGD